MEKKITIGLLGLILLLTLFQMFHGGAASFGVASCNNGNCTNFDAVDTTAGYYVDGVSIIDGSGIFVGAINATTGVFSGTLTAATTTVTRTLNVSDSASTASSTLKIGYNASGLAQGCLVLGDSAGATSTPVYITATGATITATTTQPAICK